ncbi:MAG TPA: hypothetical protein VGV93_12080 [Acidimicrobiales bacterium]|nr:hypothetical protein [Acidimicrobiales bacterium]
MSDSDPRSPVELVITHHQRHRQAGVDEDVGLLTRVVGATARLAPCNPREATSEPGGLANPLSWWTADRAVKAVPPAA